MAGEHEADEAEDEVAAAELPRPSSKSAQGSGHAGAHHEVALTPTAQHEGVPCAHVSNACMRTMQLLL